MSADDPLADWIRNPFFVLGVAPTATAVEIERAGQRLLGLLEVKSESALRYATPLGEGVRDADMVREALGRLRDPRQRLVAELWASAEAPAAEPGDERLAPWPGALDLIGWKAR